MDQSDVWALSQDALTLLDAFVYGIHHGRYRPQDLEAFGRKLDAKA